MSLEPEMAPAQVRARASQDKQDFLVLVLKAYMTSPRRIPVYGKKVERKILVAHDKLLGDLRDIQDNLSFAPAM
eukprot:3172883-Heterocapsa_arctica.AAC.1